ncbi:MAG: N-acetylmuramoyl-L-alanine amidase [Phycisphaerales bacterium]|nr:N-acetylmuramoyl-L-alanine amidase [Phycisphaerales bacterium]
MTTRTARSMRTKVVWSVLGVGMTVGIGLLSALDSGSSARTGGRSLAPLMGIERSVGMDSIFQTATPIADNRWNSIVIVHSGQPAGSAEDIASEHKSLGYDGLGFHFVVGNGKRMGDGEIHVGYRWLDQQPGADLSGVNSSFTSASAIEICLVGDGDRRPFSDEQLYRLAQLVHALSDELGIPADRVLLHKDLGGTSSPGQFFPRSEFEQLLASMG